MEKIKVQKTVFDKCQDKPFIWKDIKDFKFEDDDLIRIEYVESHYSENDSYDAHYNAEVIRMVEETDEQLQKRIEYNEIEDKRAKERRYQSYLRLKEEFGNE
jgi:RNAse (barnase) inhibitor barstar